MKKTGFFWCRMTIIGLLSAMLSAQAGLLESVVRVRGWNDYDDFLAALKEQKSQINTLRDAEGRTTLHYAAFNDTGAEVLLLLNGADPNARDNKGLTPLHRALQGKNKQHLYFLLLKGADVNAVATDGTTALGLAIQQGDLKLAELLLWVGARVELQAVPETKRPLTLAKMAGRNDLLELLQGYQKEEAPTLQAKPQIMPTFAKDAFQNAARRGDYETLTAMIAAGTDINAKDSKNMTALHRAIWAGQHEVVFYLLLLGADPNVAGGAQDRSPFMMTTGWFGGGLDDMRLYLILKGARLDDVSKDKFTELTMACHQDNEHAVTWLLWLGANPREKTGRGTPLEVAFQAGNARAIHVLRRFGITDALPLSNDPIWNLNNAAQRGDTAVIDTVLAGGTPIDSPDAAGNSPLLNAILRRNVPAARHLIAKGANIHYVNAKTGWTPLFMSIIWDYEDMTRFRLELLKAGANPNLLSKRGEPLLHRAIWHFPTTPLKQLLANGADINIRDSKGRTAVTVAIDDGKLQTADFLREQGGKE